MEYTPLKWYRIDKADGRIEYIGRTGSAKATRLLTSAIDNAKGLHVAGSNLAVIDSGRFDTVFAIYTREDRLTEREIADLEGGIRR